MEQASWEDLSLTTPELPAGLLEQQLGSDRHTASIVNWAFLHFTWSPKNWAHGHNCREHEGCTTYCGLPTQRRSCREKGKTVWRGVEVVDGVDGTRGTLVWICT